jgi:hypothetical protein
MVHLDPERAEESREPDLLEHQATRAVPGTVSRRVSTDHRPAHANVSESPRRATRVSATSGRARQPCARAMV